MGRPGSSMFGALAWAAAVLPAFACASAPGEDDGGSGSESGTEGGGLEPAEPDDRCESAPTLATGIWAGSLRGATEDLGGACGLGGPDAFVRVAPPQHPWDLRVDARGVGFLPRVGLLPSACVAGRELACTQGLPLTITDLPAGAHVLVTVGIDAEDPALGTSAPPDGEADALDFELEVLVRRILADGDYCMPESRGRCATGSACLVDAVDGGWRCERVPGDTCSSAASFDVPATTPTALELEIDPTQLQTDAHHHSCTGARMRERVLRLALSPEMSLTAQLRVSVDDPQVGLALRSPGCAAEHEIACAAPGIGPSTSAIFSDAGQAAAAGTEPFLFIELPDAPPDGPAPPIVVAFEVVDG